MYTKTLYAGWADMNFNSHMKNPAYRDKTAGVSAGSGVPFPKNRPSFSQSDSQSRSKPQPQRLAAHSGREPL